MSDQILRPGERTQTSGQYREVGPRGGSAGPEITSVAGKPLPPSSGPGRGYVLVDPTQHAQR